MDLEPDTLQDSQEFCAETTERSSGQTLVVTAPSQPRTAATVAQQEGPGLTPHTGLGVQVPGPPSLAPCAGSG